MANGASQPFRPSYTASISATTAAAETALPAGGESVLIYNATSSVAFVRFGSSAGVAATLTDLPVPPNGRMLVAVNHLVTAVSALLHVGTGTVYFSRGDGSVY